MRRPITVYDTLPIATWCEKQSIKFIYLVPYAQTAIIDYVLPYQLSRSGDCRCSTMTNSTLISDQLPELDAETTGIIGQDLR